MMIKPDLNTQDFQNIDHKDIKNLLNQQKTEGKTARPFGVSIDNFYVTDFICENSAIMAKASKSRIKNILFKDKSIYN